MKAVELKSKTLNELKDILLECRKEAMNIRFQIASGQLENLARKKTLRKDIARVNTVITQKKQVN